MLGLSIEKADDVHFVQVKGPAFTLDDIVAANHAGLTCRTDNPGKLMAFGRGASARGVGKALREIPAKTRGLGQSLLPASLTGLMDLAKL